MKSLLITGDFPPFVSGISTFFYNLVKHLSKEDLVILAPYGPGCREFDRQQGFKMYRGKFLLGKNFLGRIKKTFFFLIYSLYLVRKERIGLLICAHPISVGFVGLIFKKLFNINYYVYGWGGEASKYRSSFIITKFLNLIVNNANCVIVDSDYTGMEYEKIRFDEKGIVKIIPGVDIQKFRPGLDVNFLKKKFNLEGKKVILTVARLVKRKGHDMVIKSLPEVILKVPNLAYLIVGDGPQKEELIKLVGRNKLRPFVHFVGEIEHEKTPLFYNLCDCFVMPNRKTQGDEVVEGFGISFLEAGACAKPVIAGRSGGTGDAVEDGLTGILVDPLSTSEIANSILKFITDRDYAARLGENARLRVESHFTWQKVCDEFSKLLSL